MPLRRVTRRGVIGRPVARTAAVVGTAAVVAHGVDRRQGPARGPAGPALISVVVPDVAGGVRPRSLR